MEYKDDWPKAKERLSALWSGEIIDRACVAVTSPKKGKENEYRRLKSLPRMHGFGDGEALVRRNRALFEASYFGGESFPGIWLNLGPSGHAGYFRGVRYTVTEDSVWFDPSVTDEHEELVFDTETELYRLTLDLARYLAADSRGDYFVSMPDTSGNLDALAHLRGNEGLLMDMIADPDWVKGAAVKIEAAWEKTISDVYGIVRENNECGGMIYWLKSWAPGLHSQMQADISVMISPESYKEFILPELAAQCSFLEYPLYHFDGVEQTRHLDALLSLEKLKMIQWTCVAGQPSPARYLDTLRRMQDAGKGLLIRLTETSDIEPLLTNLSSKGLYLVADAESEEEARTILSLAERLTHE